MLRFLCDRADASGLHVYVEATSQRNLQLYERYGFRLVEVRRAYGGLRGATRSGREGSKYHWGAAGGGRRVQGGVAAAGGCLTAGWGGVGEDGSWGEA